MLNRVRGALSERLRVFHPIFAGDPGFRSTLTISLIGLLLLYWPLIDVRYYFLDDVGRALHGYYEYTICCGRPLADLLLGLLALGPPLTDVAPGPQLFGVLSLALAATLLARRFGIASPLPVAAFAVSVGGSPYFLENMSFRFDSGSMALGVLCAIAPFALARDDRPPPIATSLLLFACLNLYQPAINCYPVIALYLMAQALVRQSVGSTVASGLRYAMPLGAAVVTYWLVWKLLASHDYLAKQGKLALSRSAFRVGLENLRTYGNALLEHWASTALGWLWLVMVVSACLILVGRIASSEHRRPMAKAAAAAWAILLLLAMLPAAFLSQILLVTPIFAARAFVGFIALIAVFSASLLSVRAGVMGFLGKGLVALQALALLGFAYTYSNALRVQERYDDRITAAIVRDIMEIEPSGAVWTFVISGWIGKSPVVEKEIEKYPVLHDMVSSSVYQDSYWATTRFKSFDLWIKPAPASLIDQTAVICRGTPNKSNARYDLYLVDKTVLIRFKNDGVKCP